MGLLRQTLFICFCLNISKNSAGNKDVTWMLFMGIIGELFPADDTNFPIPQVTLPVGNKKSRTVHSGF